MLQLFKLNYNYGLGNDESETKSQPFRDISVRYRDYNSQLNYKCIVNSNIEILSMCINARSIVNKIDELELLVEQYKPDIIGITETWLNDQITDSEISLEGYTIFRKDRKSSEKSRGGGVMFYIKNNLIAVLNSELNLSKFAEGIWVDINSRKESTLIGLCYRAPDSSDENDQELVKIINSASRNKFCLIMGDFNLPDLDWKTEQRLDESHFFIKVLNNNFLTQVVKKETRLNNILDLVVVSDESIVNNVDVIEPLGASDHSIVKFYFSLNKQNQNCNKIRFDYFRADYDKIRQEVLTTDWNSIIAEQDLDKDWHSFKTVLLEIRDKLIECKIMRKVKYKWITKSVTRDRRAKVKAWKNYVRSGKKPELYNLYQIKLNTSQKTNREAKRNFEQKLASNIKNDNKSFYSYVRSKQRVVDKIGPIKNSVGNIVTNDVEVANIFNNYFSSVFTKEDSSNVPQPSQIFRNPESDRLINIDISQDIVLKKLSEINVNKSCGSDGLHPKLVYEIRNEIASAVTKIFKLSLSLGKVPSDWKNAEITPIFKKGNREDTENYRPISLTSILGKILESIVKDNIMLHLHKYSLINNSQHGFTNGRSCLTNLLDFMEVVTKELDDDNPVDIVYLDFCKAFDKVPHRRLLAKVKALGIDGILLNWVENWLSGRKQKVALNGHFSDWADVISGVPQGSVLGPLLFVIYINDIDKDILSKLSKFADDTKICRAVKNDSDRNILNNDLEKLHKWSEDWQMLFNVDKCAVVHVGNRNKNYTYTIGDKVIKNSDKEKDLGVVIDRSGKVSEQCRLAAAAANKTLGMIKRSIYSRNRVVILNLYKSLVRPKLEYCIQVWSPYLKKDIDILEKVQRRATKLISECQGLSYVDRLSVCNLTTLQKRRLRGDLIETFKLIRGFENLDCRTFFNLSNSNRTRGHRYKLVKNRSRLDIRKYFFSQRIVDTWNKLPQVVVEAPSVNLFKNKLDLYNRFDM